MKQSLQLVSFFLTIHNFVNERNLSIIYFHQIFYSEDIGGRPSVFLIQWICKCYTYIHCSTLLTYYAWLSYNVAFIFSSDFNWRKTIYFIIQTFKIIFLQKNHVILLFKLDLYCTKGSYLLDQLSCSCSSINRQKWQQCESVDRVCAQLDSIVFETFPRNSEWPCFSVRRYNISWCVPKETTEGEKSRYSSLHHRPPEREKQSWNTVAFYMMNNWIQTYCWVPKFPRISIPCINRQ